MPKMMMSVSACCYSGSTDVLRLTFSDDTVDVSQASPGPGQPCQSADSARIDH